jgi:AraC-like DNA-binding protein
MRRDFEKIKPKDWPEFARQAGYCVKTAALHLGMSPRWFEVAFKARFGETPCRRFAWWREQEIRRQARDGKDGKAIARQLGIGHKSSLSRILKRLGLRLRELNKPNHPLLP